MRKPLVRTLFILLAVVLCLFAGCSTAKGAAPEPAADEEPLTRSAMPEMEERAEPLYEEPEELDWDALKHAKALHMDGHMLDAAAAAAEFCRKNGVKVSYDAGGTYPNVDRLMPWVDYLIPSEEFALKFTGKPTAEEAAACLYETWHPELVVVTQGTRGGLLLDENGLRRYDSYPVKALDTNGCGDTFHGAFLAGKLRGLNNDDACRYASAAAAVKCTRLGARYAMATHEECLSFLKERGVEL